MAGDRDPSRRLTLLADPKKPTKRTPAPSPAAEAAPCLRYHAPRHPDDDSPDRPLIEFGDMTLGFAGEFMRDAAQLLEDLAGNHPGGTTPDRTETVEVRVGSLQFVAESLREMGSRCGETHRAEVLGHRAESIEAKDAP